MSEKNFLFRSSAGIDHFLVRDGKDFRFASTQDVDPILDRNKAMATHNDGYTPSRDVKRVATIPYIVGLKWLNEEGWWFMDTHDPDVARKLAQKLNDPDWRHLRTADGQVGVSNGVIR